MRDILTQNPAALWIVLAIMVAFVLIGETDEPPKRGPWG